MKKFYNISSIISALLTIFIFIQDYYKDIFTVKVIFIAITFFFLGLNIGNRFHEKRTDIIDYASKKRNVSFVIIVLMGLLPIISAILLGYFGLSKWSENGKFFYWIGIIIGVPVIWVIESFFYIEIDILLVDYYNGKIDFQNKMINYEKNKTD